MAKDTHRSSGTLDDAEIVTRRQAFGLAAAAIGAGVFLSRTARADEDTSNETSYDTTADDDTATNEDTSNETNHDTTADEDVAEN